MIYLNHYFNKYISNIDLIKTNNNIIYTYIKTNIIDKKIILTNSNINNIIIELTNNIKQLVIFDKSNKKIVFLDIINKIIKSIYDKNYF